MVKGDGAPVALTFEGPDEDGVPPYPEVLVPCGPGLLGVLPVVDVRPMTTIAITSDQWAKP